METNMFSNSEWIKTFWKKKGNTDKCTCGQWGEKFSFQYIRNCGCALNLQAIQNKPDPMDHVLFQDQKIRSPFRCRERKVKACEVRPLSLSNCLWRFNFTTLPLTLISWLLLCWSSWFESAVECWQINCLLGDVDLILGLIKHGFLSRAMCKTRLKMALKPARSYVIWGLTLWSFYVFLCVHLLCTWWDFVWNRMSRPPVRMVRASNQNLRARTA